MHQQEVTDPVENMLKKTGCMELHFKVQVKISVNKTITDEYEIILKHALFSF